MPDLKEQIRKINWHVFHKRPRSVFFQLLLSAASVQKPGIPFDHRIEHFGNFFSYIALDESAKSRLCDTTIKHLQNEPDFLLKLMECAYREHAEYITLWGKKQDYPVMSNEQLADALAAYAKHMLQFGIYVALPLMVEDYLEQTLMDAFTKRFGSDAQKWFGIAVDPVKDATVLQEELALLALAEKKTVTEQDLAQHAERFSWMANVSFTEDYYPISYYKARLEELRKKKTSRGQIDAQREQHRKSFAELLKRCSDDSYLATMIKTANEAVYFRSYRTELWYSSARYFTPLFKEIAKRLGLADYKDVLWLYWDESVDLLNKGKPADTALIAERKKGYIYFCDHDGEYRIWQGKEAQEIFEAFQKAQSAVPADAKELKGSGAYPGKVKGKAVVVNSLDEVGKVHDGDILIVHATNVNFVPTLKKVSAIVTEEGGILSHAAIISRELRIPAVIGTKIATKVFKDGDFIEVDAEKGMVKKLG